MEQTTRNPCNNRSTFTSFCHTKWGDASETSEYLIRTRSLALLTRRRTMDLLEPVFVHNHRCKWLQFEVRRCWSIERAGYDSGPVNSRNGTAISERTTRDGSTRALWRVHRDGSIRTVSFMQIARPILLQASCWSWRQRVHTILNSPIILRWFAQDRWTFPFFASDCMRPTYGKAIKRTEAKGVCQYQ